MHETFTLGDTFYAATANCSKADMVESALKSIHLIHAAGWWVVFFIMWLCIGKEPHTDREYALSYAASAILATMCAFAVWAIFY